jgi:chorismate--pyruvate lyase
MTSQHALFPVQLTAQWQSSDAVKLSASMHDWLLHNDSLTAKLKRHCKDFRVEVLGQEVQACQASEACEGISEGEQVLVREVLLFCDNIPHVFARSLLPLTSLTGKQHQLAHLGEQPLGQVIFNNENLQRKLIELACFDSESSVVQLLKNITALNTELIPDRLWGRRSLFVIDEKPIQVAEVFLPAALMYKA